ncbi:MULTISPECIES: hypothetical protein [Neobacillus]|uniref:Uncharacterized protein n=1 Tax=Neobacillus citreus TaxID=2833578 RepID=A0A942Y737_9BACI|nr:MULTISPECIES: hypothetical protein [Neobacillus]MBU8918701.1 hypothetical protein [Bacillus sp. FJAT-29953]MCH6265485.1 hypothetical protein [Neobacillus citreus]
MMRFFKNLFVEHCPKCNKELETHKSNLLSSVVVKSCPEQHYQKEYHPAFETYIESDTVS